MKRIEVIGLETVGEIAKGDSIGRAISDACEREKVALASNDVVVVAHKIVSKAEGLLVRLSEVEPSSRAIDLARDLGKDPALVEVILRESRRVVRMGRGTLVVETHHGFICANAGVDLSNVGVGLVALLPRDPDRSAAAIRREIQSRVGVAAAVIVSDSFGRPWRLGTVDVAIGVAGCKPLLDDRDKKDRYGYALKAAVSASADELAAAAELVMGKTDNVPVVVIKGYGVQAGVGSARDILRPEADDLFRNF
jgi:coenzyme F420-0:L-glutamate ligase/coenzyme F420-1:gamma-L-glutamate ligase